MLLINIVLHFRDDVSGIWPTLSMVMLIMIMIFKTLFFLKVFESISYLNVMIFQVIYDLRHFMLIILIFCFMFGLINGVLGLGNEGEDPSKDEYHYVGHLSGGIIDMFNHALGSLNVRRSLRIDRDGHNKVFWTVYVITMFMLTIIILNFIIAEVSVSYNKVSQNVRRILIHEKVCLIQEAEMMMLDISKTKK